MAHLSFKKDGFNTRIFFDGNEIVCVPKIVLPESKFADPAISFQPNGEGLVRAPDEVHLINARDTIGLTFNNKEVASVSLGDFFQAGEYTFQKCILYNAQLSERLADVIERCEQFAKHARVPVQETETIDRVEVQHPPAHVSDFLLQYQGELLAAAEQKSEALRARLAAAFTEMNKLSLFAAENITPECAAKLFEIYVSVSDESVHDAAKKYRYREELLALQRAPHLVDAHTLVAIAEVVRERAAHAARVEAAMDIRNAPRVRPQEPVKQVDPLKETQLVEMRRRNK